MVPLEQSRVLRNHQAVTGFDHHLLHRAHLIHLRLQGIPRLPTLVAKPENPKGEVSFSIIIQ